jgi:hypothetical protein
VIHARKDYDRIQDPAGLIPVDEPVFLLRGTDPASPMVVATWANMVESMGAHPEIVAAARSQVIRMREYQAAKGIKLPDMPLDAARD